MSTSSKKLRGAAPRACSAWVSSGDGWIACAVELAFADAACASVFLESARAFVCPFGFDCLRNAHLPSFSPLWVFAECNAAWSANEQASCTSSVSDLISDTAPRKARVISAEVARLIGLGDRVAALTAHAFSMTAHSINDELQLAPIAALDGSTCDLARHPNGAIWALSCDVRL